MHREEMSCPDRSHHKKLGSDNQTTTDKQQVPNFSARQRGRTSLSELLVDIGSDPILCCKDAVKMLLVIYSAR